MYYTDKPLDVPDLDPETGNYTDNQGNKCCSLYVKYKLIYKDENNQWQFAKTEDGVPFVTIIESVIKKR